MPKRARGVAHAPARTSRRGGRGARATAPPSASSTTEPSDASASRRAFWSGTLSFGLVSIPVDLHAATRSRDASLRMLAPDGTPLARRYFCPEDERELGADEIVRGLEHEPGVFIELEADELAALAPEKTRDIDLRQFVSASSIPTLCFERGYVLTPSGNSGKAYRLLAAVMEQRSVAGIATFVLRDHERVVAIFSSHGVLRAETLRFGDEIRARDDLGIPPAKMAQTQQSRDYERWIARLRTEAFDPNALRDPEAAALHELAQRKHRSGTDVVVHAEPEADSGGGGADVIDLMAILKKSLGETKASPRRKRST